jgi:hypothetical protein
MTPHALNQIKGWGREWMEGGRALTERYHRDRRATEKRQKYKNFVSAA